jgi:RNA polymerase sigma-70 factor (ECF subfamily)
MTKDELLQRCRENDPDAFELLVKTYQNKIINIAYGMLADREDAYDVAQEVFVKLYRKIGSFTGAAALDTWIYRITVNASLDELRKRGRRVRTVPIALKIDDEEEYDLPIADEKASPENIALSNERRREILGAVSKLSEKYRSVLILREFEDLEYEQIAQVLGISVGTVKSRLSRARENLRNLLEK